MGSQPTRDELERELVLLRLELERIRRLQQRYREETRPGPRRRPRQRAERAPRVKSPGAEG
jgi:hypothetical protein